jgi:hypothetical protein
MSKATYPFIEASLFIKKAAQQFAKEDGVSLNQWIAAMVAEKVGVVKARPTFSRSQQARPPAKTHEVSSYRAQDRARPGRRASIAAVKNSRPSGAWTGHPPDLK